MSSSTVRLGLAALLSCLASAAVAEPLWTYDSDAEIVFQRLTPLGNLLISTETRLMAVDPESGQTLWTRDDVKKLKECNYDEVANTPYGLLDLGDGVGGMQRRIEVIDLQTGLKKWDSKDLPMNSSQGLFQVPQHDMLLMIGVPKKGSKPVLVAVDLETGALRWQQDALFTRPLYLFEVRGSGRLFKRYSIEGSQHPVFDTDDTAILYLSDEGPIKIDLATGNKLWTADKLKGKQPPAPRNGYAPMVLGKGVVFVPFGKSLQALDVNTGLPLWKETRKLKSPVAQMQLVTEGLVVRGAPQVDEKGKPDGKPFIDLLDPKTGQSAWRTPFKDLEDATTFDVRAGRLYIAADGELFSINVADGTAASLAKFRFKGNEVPGTLEVLNNNYLLLSSQNVMMFDRSGAMKYHSYFSAPAASGWSKFASTTALMAANAASAANAHSRAMSSGQDQSYSLVTSNPALSKRFKASTNANAYASILTSVESDGQKGPGLVKVEKSTGKEVARVRLDDKTPQYEMDDVEGRVFFMKSEKQIICYRF